MIDLNWDLWNVIFGSIAIIGPILLIVWYVKEVKTKLKKLNEK